MRINYLWLLYVEEIMVYFGYKYKELFFVYLFSIFRKKYLKFIKKVRGCLYVFLTLN